ncbi:hypothetical protein ACFE04_026343 [Oxalis oulophora]
MSKNRKIDSFFKRMPTTQVEFVEPQSEHVEPIYVQVEDLETEEPSNQPPPAKVMRTNQENPKSMLEELRLIGWNSLFEKVIFFCESRAIEFATMTLPFSDILRSRRRKENVDVEHH